MKHSLLIADACVIIDHGYIGGLKWLTQLGRVEVLDVVLAECHHKKQPGLIEEAKAAGIIEVEAADQYAEEAALVLRRPLEGAFLEVVDSMGGRPGRSVPRWSRRPGADALGPLASSRLRSHSYPTGSLWGSSIRR